MKLRSLSLSFLLLLSTVTFAQTSSQPSSQVSNPTSTPQAAPQTSNQATPSVITENGQQYSVQQVFCPNPQELVKSGLYWGTSTGGWRSYAESFDTNIVSFLGAQWVGINVGKMICIYKGNISMSFPITVQNDTLTQAPSGGSWGNDLGGYRNCHSTNMADCPFTVKTQVVNMQQIYNSLDFFKGKPNPVNNSTQQ